MNYFIEQNDEHGYSNIKIEYHDPTDTGRVVSQTFPYPSGKPPTQVRSIIGSVGNSLPKIAIKKENSFNQKEVVLVNGCWDTTNKIPNIVAEMRNIKTDDFTSLQNGFKNRSLAYTNGKEISPRGSDSGIESDCADGNLSWLLNYKIPELPPVPDALSENEQKNNKDNNVSPLVPLNTTTYVIPEDELKNMNNQHQRYSGPKKPPFTYTELIEHALSEKGELTVSGIYNWISDHFPFYKRNDDRWKNSVRHNLSINPHFRKGGKAVHGAGHLWTVAQQDDNKTWKMRQRIQQFLQTTNQTPKDPKSQEQEDFDRELQAATQSILGEIQNQNKNDLQVVNPNKNNEIQLEFINVSETPTGLEDFLSPPVSKQEIVNECGLGSDFFITDINPNTLGLNLVEAEAVSEDVIYDEMSFDYYGMK